MSRRETRIMEVVEQIIMDMGLRYNSSYAFRERARVHERAAVAAALIDVVPDDDRFSAFSLYYFKVSLHGYLHRAAKQYLKAHPNVFENDEQFNPTRFYLLAEGIAGKDISKRHLRQNTAVAERAWLQGLRMMRTGRLSYQHYMPTFAKDAYKTQMYIEALLYDKDLQREQLQFMKRSLTNRSAAMNDLYLRVQKRIEADFHLMGNLREFLMREVWLKAVLPEVEYVMVRDQPMALLDDLYAPLVGDDPTRFGHLVEDCFLIKVPPSQNS